MVDSQYSSHNWGKNKTKAWKLSKLKSIPYSYSNTTVICE